MKSRNSERRDQPLGIATCNQEYRFDTSSFREAPQQSLGEGSQRLDRPDGHRGSGVCGPGYTVILELQVENNSADFASVSCTVDGRPASTKS